MSAEQFSYEGKRVLVIGGATGMGAAVAQLLMSLGARAIVMDVAGVSYSVDQSIKVNLANRVSVDAAINQLDGSLDAVFCCAGVAGGSGILFINFIGQRYIVDTLVNNDSLTKGAAITMISSVAGMSWMQNLPEMQDFLAQNSWQKAAEWVARRDGASDYDNYMFSKQAMNAYVAQKALAFIKKGVRINAIMPGPTDTPLARANAEQWLGFGAAYRDDADIDPLSPGQVAGTLAFLCSEAASGINGISLLIDSGHVSSVVSGAYDDPMLKMVM